MRVLFLADGNSVHTIKWVNLLTENGVDIFLFSLTTFDESQYNNARSVSAGFNKTDTNTDNNDSSKLKYIRVLIQVKGIIKSFKPDIIHSHYATSYGLLGVLTSFNPLVISVWGSDVYYFPKKTFLHKLLLIFNLKYANFILSTSTAMASEVKLYTRKNVEITPFGIDTKIFSPKKVGSLFEENSIVIGTIKSMDEIYGIEYLIKAFSILKKKYSNIRLLLVGGASKSNSEYLNYLKRLASDLKIDNETLFTGLIPHEVIPDYHNMITIPVYVSLRESFGVSVLESQACEKAVVVSNIGGLPDVIKENQTGFIVSAKNEIETAMAIEKLILDENLRLQMGKNARKWVIDNYSSQVALHKMMSFYQRVLKS